MWILDGSSTGQAAQSVFNFADLLHALWVAFAVWLGNSLHGLTDGSRK